MLAQYRIDPPGPNGRGQYVDQAHPLPAAPPPFVPVGAHKSDRVILTAQTIELPDGASCIALSCTGAAARYTLDGSAPTATHGHYLAVDRDPIVLSLGETAILKIIQVSATCKLQEQPGQ
jgi:hypothetical protein